MRSTRRFMSLVSVVAVCVLAVGCRARADVVVAVEPNGSGSVTVTAVLDADAVAQLGGDVGEVIRTEDLAATGWKVADPERRGADTVLTVSKQFARPEDLGPIVSDLGGADGPFADWRLTSTDSFTVTDYRLTGKVRLTGDLAQFSDGEVSSALDGLPLGRTADELAAALDGGKALTLNVVVRLPGEVDRASGLAEKDPGAGSPSASFALGTGTATDTAVVVESSDSDRSSVLWILAGALVLVAAAVVVLRRPRGRVADPAR